MAHDVPYFAGDESILEHVLCSTQLFIIVMTA
jgi:hypothetical protein